jgi:hypothetical protein
LKRPFHPLFFAAYPVLSLYAANTALFPPSDLWEPLGIVVVATTLFFGLLWGILRSRERAAAGASIAVISFFGYGPLMDVLYPEASARMVAAPLAQPAACLLGVALLVAACWKWRRSTAICRALNVAGIVLVAVPAFTIGWAWIQGSRIPAGSISSGGAPYRGPRPDIFYVILDGYGRSDVLRREMGFDNSTFLDGLRKLGFYVADESRSNYCQTEISLSSSLNLDYIPKIVPNFSPQQQSRGVFDGLIDRSGLSRRLKGLGYTYVAVTTGFPAIYPKSADLLLETQRGDTLFETALMQRTPLSGLHGGIESQYESRRKTLTTAIHALGVLGQTSSRPRFVLAHILAPHPPFVFGPNGEPRQPKRMFALVDGSHFMQNGGTPDEYREGYAGQAETISRMVLQSIGELLKSSRTPPIIVIQGDHGPKLHLDQEDLAKTDVREVFPILNAYYVPPKIRARLYPGITPVNSFRTILREQFGEDLPNLEDKSWYSPWTFPFRFTDVTQQVTGPKPPKP